MAPDGTLGQDTEPTQQAEAVAPAISLESKKAALGELLTLVHRILDQVHRGTAIRLDQRGDIRRAAAEAGLSAEWTNNSTNLLAFEHIVAEQINALSTQVEPPTDQVVPQAVTEQTGLFRRLFLWGK